MKELTDYDRTRYHRQMLIRGWGETGQQKLKSSCVLVAGAGGLGSPVALYLAAAGVGEIRICDADRVELSNLNRQLLHTDERIGELKAESARRTLEALNPTLRIVSVPERLDAQSLPRIAEGADLLIDCLDNFETRYMLNGYSLAQRVPLVHGAVWGLTAQVTVFRPPETPCLQCLFPEPPPREVFPVAGVTPGFAGCLQALEALKYLTGTGDLLAGRLLVYDGEGATVSVLNLHRVESCPACGHLAAPPVPASREAPRAGT